MEVLGLLTLLHSEQPKLHIVLAILSATGFTNGLLIDQILINADLRHDGNQNLLVTCEMHCKENVAVLIEKDNNCLVYHMMFLFALSCSHLLALA